LTVKIVTDSVSDLPAEVVEELGISIVPILVRFGEEEYRDSIDITPEQFYKKLRTNKLLPSTSVPSPAKFAETFDMLAQETDQIVTITLSAKLSGMYNVALQAKDLMKRKCQVIVLDSSWAAMAEGLVVIEAATAANTGANIQDVAKIARKTISRVDFIAALDTLEYLRRGGRIGRAQALLGSALNIKPIIRIKDGVVEPVTRVLSRSKAIEYLYDFVKNIPNIKAVAVGDADAQDDAELLHRKIREGIGDIRIYRSKATPVMGAHAGPGFLAVSVLNGQ
jgi:DegV family protein with EDD domain